MGQSVLRIKIESRETIRRRICRTQMLLPKMICPGGNTGRRIGLQVDVGLDLVRARSGTQRGYLTGRRSEGVVPFKDRTTKSDQER